jgi:hypothetical protein
MSFPNAERPAESKKPRVAGKYKDGLSLSRGIPVSVDGMSVCQLCLTFGIEQKPAIQPARGGRKRRSPNLKLWTVKDFCRAWIKERYSLSHPNRFTAFQSAVAKDHFSVSKFRESHHRSSVADISL